jgi:hypothetical protein
VRDSGTNQSFWRLAILGTGAIFAVVMLVRWTHHRNSVTDAAATTVVDDSKTPEATAEATAASKMSPLTPRLTVVNTQTMQAECHPHLSANTDSVPNFDVSQAFNPSAIRMKVRFWVNGDGFTTNQFVENANSILPGDQTAAMDFVRHLTFGIPNTPQCHERRMEMIGTFIESMDAAGQWATLFDVHPRYYVENGVVVNRPQ